MLIDYKICFNITLKVNCFNNYYSITNTSNKISNCYGFILPSYFRRTFISVNLREYFSASMHQIIPFKSLVLHPGM